MMPQDSRRTGNRHVAIALLSTVLLWVILSQGQKEGQWAGKGERRCLGLMVAAGEVKKPGTFLLSGNPSEQGCSMSLKAVLNAAGGLRGGNPLQVPCSLRQEQILPGQKLLVTRNESGDFLFQLKPMAGGKKLVWGKKLNVNEASREELSLIPRMRPPFADAIVKRREGQRWNALADLTEIRGVGPKTVQLWSEYLEADQGS